MKFNANLTNAESRKFIEAISDICDIVEQPDDRRGLEESTREHWNKPETIAHFCGGTAGFSIGDDGMAVTVEIESAFALKVMSFSTKIARKIYPAYTAVKGIFDMILGTATELGKSWRELIAPYRIRTERVLVRLYDNGGLGVTMMVVEEVDQFGEHEQVAWYHIKNHSGLPDCELHHLTENNHGDAYMVKIAEISDPDTIGDKEALKNALSGIERTVRDEIHDGIFNADKYAYGNVKAYDDEEPTGSAVRYYGFDLHEMSESELEDLRAAAYSRRRDLFEFPDYDFKVSDQQRFKGLTTADLTELIHNIDLELAYRKY